ncbi:putative phage tail tape measure domain protein [Clostridioides difficile DA00129]|nr:phage tail tape measure domain protein [Clostridioides difficile]EQG39387.1 putative phage tail tape measure domain protein [Clostridioides difficile DA00129]
MQKELEKVLAERKKRIEQQEIEDKKEALKKRKEELEEKKKDEIENINQIYESEKEYYNKRLEDAKKFYDERIKESKLQAEAEKLIMDKNQKEIVALLNSYSDAYKNAGQTLGEKLLEGFKPAINEIKNLIDSITREINNARN